MGENINWEEAAMELCRRLAKYEYLVDRRKNILTYVPNGPETAEISVRAAAIFTDVTRRHSQ